MLLGHEAVISPERQGNEVDLQEDAGRSIGIFTRKAGVEFRQAGGRGLRPSSSFRADAGLAGSSPRAVQQGVPGILRISRLFRSDGSPRGRCDWAYARSTGWR